MKQGVAAGHSGPIGKFYVRARLDEGGYSVAVWNGRREPHGKPATVQRKPAHRGLNAAVNETLAALGHKP